MNPSRVLCSSLLGPEANRAIRVGNWKLVAKGTDGPWELYDLTKDRSELHNLAAEQPDRVKDLTEKWQHWAEQSLVFPLNPFNKRAAGIARGTARLEGEAPAEPRLADHGPARQEPRPPAAQRSRRKRGHLDLSARCAEKGVTLIYLRAANSTPLAHAKKEG
jgi:hypothetical protein